MPITWMRMHGNLYRAIEFQRAMMFLLLSLLVGVAAFNLVSALIMVVNQRRGDVAVLRTLGGGTRTIVVSFLVLGGVIGLAGVGLGLLLGTGAALLVQDGYQWLEHTLGLHLMNQYFISYLPAQVKVVGFDHGGWRRIAARVSAARCTRRIALRASNQRTC